MVLRKILRSHVVSTCVKRRMVAWVPTLSPTGANFLVPILSHLRWLPASLILPEATPQNIFQPSSWCAMNLWLGCIKNHYVLYTLFIMLLLYILLNINNFSASHLHMEYRMYKNNVLFGLILYGKWACHRVSKRERPVANKEHIQVGLVEKWKRQFSGEYCLQRFRIFASFCHYFLLAFCGHSDARGIATMSWYIISKMFQIEGKQATRQGSL